VKNDGMGSIWTIVKYNSSFRQIFHFSLLTFHYSLVFPNFITHSFLIDAISDHLLISIERRSACLNFQKHYLIQISLGKSIQNQVIDAFSQKHEIFVEIRKIRQKRSYFFIHVSKYDIAWSGNSITSLFFYFEHEIDSCNEISYNESKKDTNDDKSEIRIHIEK